MKAVRLLEYGGQLVFNDVPTQTIAPDQILVKIKSTAVNHVDLVKASGTVRQIFPIDLPWIPGHESSNRVRAPGFGPWQVPGDVLPGLHENSLLALRPTQATRSTILPCALRLAGSAPLGDIP